jgi:hypothetical protein
MTEVIAVFGVFALMTGLGCVCYGRIDERTLNVSSFLLGVIGLDLLYVHMGASTFLPGRTFRCTLTFIFRGFDCFNY